MAQLKLYNNELIRDFGIDNEMIEEMVEPVQDLSVRQSINRMTVQGSLVNMDL